MSRSTFKRLPGAVLALVIALGSAGAVAAATVNVEIAAFARSDIANAQAAHAAFLAGADAEVFGTGGHFGPSAEIKAHRTEAFAGHAAWDGSAGTTDPAGTAVGSFASLGGTGTGSSAINGGTGLEVRNDDPFRWGRFSVLDPAGSWLDSNDTYGMRWDVGGLGAFNALTFFLTDVADVGAKFSLRVGDTLYDNLIGGDGRTANGTIHWVRILLDEAVSSLVVELRHDRLNDGFGIDGVTIAHVAPIPVPPAAALMVSGVIVLVGLRRRRRAAA
jgi:hypothetical protein